MKHFVALELSSEEVCIAYDAAQQSLHPVIFHDPSWGAAGSGVVWQLVAR